MKARLIKVDDIYRLLREDNLIIGTTDKEYQKAFADHCILLSIKNCQAIELGYDLDELYDEVDKSFDYSEFDFISFRLGFQKALELIGDKKFTEQDVISMIEKSRETGLTAEYLILTKQQTEWDVEVEWETDTPTRFQKRNIVRKLDNGEEIEWECFWDNVWWTSDGVRCPNVISWEKMPVLDSNGCLILKSV